MVQWLRLCASTSGSPGSVPGWGTKILHATWHGQKIKNKLIKQNSADTVSKHSAEEFPPHIKKKIFLREIHFLKTKIRKWLVLILRESPETFYRFPTWAEKSLSILGSETQFVLPFTQSMFTITCESEIIWDTKDTEMDKGQGRKMLQCERKKSPCGKLLR